MVVKMTPCQVGRQAPFVILRLAPVVGRRGTPRAFVSIIIAREVLGKSGHICRTVIQTDRFLWNLNWVPARLHAQSHQFSKGGVQVPAEPTLGSYRARCTEPPVFRRECVDSCGTYTGFLQGSMHRTISFQRGACRFLRNLHWVSTGFHAQNHQFSKGNV